ncbi:MAG: flagellar hook-basal body complex protein [Sphingomonadaceae bacterium]|nr:flagellar hook-basal body complex protein [Sphingomonadaceae bacterium]
MDRVLYTALSGMRRSETGQAVLANNLANAGTAGFRRDLAVASSHWLAAADLAGARAQSAEKGGAVSAAEGPSIETGNALHARIVGAGLFELIGPDGPVYTRNGAFSLAPDGRLVGEGGLAVRGEAGPIALPPGTQPEILEDGSVLARGPNNPPGAAQPAGRLLVMREPDGLSRSPRGELVASGPVAPLPAAEVRLQPGALEQANVAPVEELTRLIETARGFEMQTRIVREARELDSSSAALLRIEP